jgi:hypothetical protein
MNKKTIFYVGLYAVAAFGAYYLYNNTKRAYALTILKEGKAGGGLKGLFQFGKNFLKPWAMAAKAKQPTFEFEGKNYNTQGGMVVR